MATKYIFWVLMVCGTPQDSCDFSPFRLDSQAQCEYVKTRTLNLIYNKLLKDQNKEVLEGLQRDVVVECIPSNELGTQ